MKKYLLILPLVALLLLSCDAKENFRDPDGPRFEGNFAVDTPEFEDVIKVITWNIKLAGGIETAIREAGEAEELKNADIILLQEMDETGAEAIAQTLQYNYIYFPASVNSYAEKNLGNAILARWPITDAKKVLLPYESPIDKEKRIATRAIVHVGNLPILTYSVHTETMFLGPQQRGEQIAALVADIPPEAPLVIVGGDFNTMTNASISDMESHFAVAELERVSAEAGYTFVLGGVEFTMDHILARGLSMVETGVWRDSVASDHYPLWVTMKEN